MIDEPVARVRYENTQQSRTIRVLTFEAIDFGLCELIGNRFSECTTVDVIDISRAAVAMLIMLLSRVALE